MIAFECSSPVFFCQQVSLLLHINCNSLVIFFVEKPLRVLNYSYIKAYKLIVCFILINFRIVVLLPQLSQFFDIITASCRESLFKDTAHKDTDERSFFLLRYF